MKESKGATMIRRRKQKTNPEERDTLRQKCSPSSGQTYSAISDDDGTDSYILSDDFLGKTVLKSIMLSTKTIFLGLIALRIVNALLIQTFFVPDEYWQSIEVAHNIVFRYGYLTWEWREGLRSYIYPGMFAILYKILALTKLDYRCLIIKLPQLVQAVIAAYGDLHLYKLCEKLSGRATAQWALLSHVLSWFTLYMSTRTLTNSTEAVATLVALYHYPWPNKRNARGSWRFILACAISVIIRPTASITWVLMCAWHFQRNVHSYTRFIPLYFIIGSSVLLFSSIVDRIMYGRSLLVPYNFIRFNVLSGVGSFYGTHPWHWYITQGFPAVVFTHFYPFVRGACISQNKVPLIIVLWNLSCYSLLGHKEFRFIYPILPLCMYYCGVYLQSLSAQSLNCDGNSAKVLLPVHQDSSNASPMSQAPDRANTDDTGDLTRLNQTKQSSPIVDCAYMWKTKVIILLLALTNIPAAMYFCLVHQRGTIVVMNFLAKQTTLHDNMSVLFLMPCHSTPFYSHLHSNVSLRFLTCEPNLTRDPSYLDEADVFYNDPVTWMDMQVFHGRTLQPSHIVYFDNINDSLRDILPKYGYEQCASFFHSHFTQGRVGKYVTVSCLTRKY